MNHHRLKYLRSKLQQTVDTQQNTPVDKQPTSQQKLASLIKCKVEPVLKVIDDVSKH